MKKFSILALSVLALAGAAVASPKPPTSISCAVMASNKVDIAKATKNHMYADYKGRRYFFCCGGCPSEFKKDPAKFAKSASIPTPKTPKTK
jgi:YHS domain-containing protein